MIRKLQVFISSTFEDMQEERQAAVEAVLEARHIPAGMELFSASNESQLETIKRWILESDVYLLLLGGRYGSIEPHSGKSYIHVEYEYALQRNMPIFAAVTQDNALQSKVKRLGTLAFEQENAALFRQFRQLVLSKTAKFFEDNKDIKIAIHQTFSELSQRSELSGWVRAGPTHARLVEELTALSEENRKLRASLSTAPSPLTDPSPVRLPPNLTNGDIVSVLRSELIKMPPEQRFSVIFFQHIDEGFELPPGTAKRLLSDAAKGVFDVASRTENTITFRAPPLTFTARRPEGFI